MSKILVEQKDIDLLWGQIEGAVDILNRLTTGNLTHHKNNAIGLLINVKQLWDKKYGDQK